MLFAFLLVGSGLVIAALRDLILKLCRMAYFRRAKGSVLKVEREKYLPPPGGFRHRKTRYKFFPVVKFKHLSGEEVVCKLPVGEIGETSKYRVGQKIPIVYDLDDKLPPMINSFSGVWLPVIAQTFAGIVFIGAAALIYAAFGKKIFGGG